MSDKQEVEGILVFDFDRSLVDVDSDEYVVEQFAGEKAKEKLLQFDESLPSWNHAVKKTFEDIQDKEKGKVINEHHIEKMMGEIKLHPDLHEVLELAKKKNWDIAIVSDANDKFIPTWINKHDLNHMFDKVVTNPAHFDDEGVLKVSPLMGNEEKSKHPEHNCTICPNNLCKGQIMRDLVRGYPSVAFIGDGHGDMCPSLHLMKNDIVLCRKDYTLHKRIQQSIDPNDEFMSSYEEITVGSRPRMKYMESVKDRLHHSSENNSPELEKKNFRELDYDEFHTPFISHVKPWDDYNELAFHIEEFINGNYFE